MEHLALPSDHRSPSATRRRYPELRYLSRSLSGVAVAAVGLVAWWWSPLSPVALERPADLAIAGQIDEAADAYEVLARGWGPASVREEALWRSAMLRSIEPGFSRRAVALLEEFEQTWPQSRHRPQVLAYLAQASLTHNRDPLKAASLWSEAAATGPSDPEASRWLLDAGLAYSRAGRDAEAERSLCAATTDPDRAVTAWLALARHQLDAHPEEAYAAYTSALDAAGSGPKASLARIGRDVALDRLEDRWSDLADARYVGGSEKVHPARRR